MSLLNEQEVVAILDSLREGILVVDPSLAVTYCNPAASEITGFTPSEILHRPCTDILEGSLCDSRCLMAEAQNGRFTTDSEVEIRRKDGGARTIALTTVLLRDSRGHTKGVVVSFRDISEYRLLKEELRRKYQLDKIIGKSRGMQEVFDLIRQISPTDVTVLITGESGTGKELVAQAIHHLSPRATRPFLKVNCSALPETLLEAELFGHVRGAFTGAVHDRIGRFEAADGGTLLLDEIGELSPYLQVKLLRVLQEKEFERVGETKTRKVNVRILASTNRDLKEQLARGSIREDLYYRLKVVPIHLPPLRDRKEDIPLLIKHFVPKFNREMNKHILGPDAQVMGALLDYSWPGNVRELEHAVEHAFVRAQGVHLTVADLPEEVRAKAQWPHDEEKARILHAIKHAGGNKSAAARMLGIGRATLWRKIRKWQFPPEIPTHDGNGSGAQS